MNNPSSWLPPGFDMPRPTPPVPAVLHAVGPTDRPDAANVSHPAPAAALPRQVVTSFDVFDTLIARRCMHPQQIFVEMERRSGLPGLAQQRIEAERRVQRGARASHHVLADIYRELSAAMALDEAQTEALAQLEIQVEFDNVVPIADNLARLDAHSLLLSDMYLPEAVIRALLRRAGLSPRTAPSRST
jgi:predicted HAD superfamily hydrolase